MLTADQVTITAGNKDLFRAALTILTENRGSLEDVLRTEPVPFDIDGCKFVLTKPEEIGQAIEILRGKLNV